MTDLKPDDKRWSLTMERERRGLVSRAQFRKLPLKKQQTLLKKNAEVRFPWGTGTARGYKI